MTIRFAAVSLVIALSGCGNAAQNDPSFEEVSGATLTYARCIDEAAGEQASAEVPTSEAATRAIASCSKQRASALDKMAVPVMAPSVEEFDEIHEGLARSSVERIRGEAK